MSSLSRLRGWLVKYGLVAGIVAVAFGYREHRLSTAPEPSWENQN